MYKLTLRVMAEESLNLMTEDELFALLNQTGEQFLFFPKDSLDAQEKKKQLYMILDVIIAKRTKQSY